MADSERHDGTGIHSRTIERWGTLELVWPDGCCSDGRKPVGAEFVCGAKVREALVFHEEEGGAKLRFMPDEIGEWTYRVFAAGSADVEAAESGVFVCTPPQAGNHGYVGVISESDFAYADGTPYYPLGTCCLEWRDREELIRTVEAVAASPFNKLRLRVEPYQVRYPALEEAVLRLLLLGVETELLLTCNWTSEEYGDGELLAEAVARFAGYRHVWWTLEASLPDGSAGAGFKPGEELREHPALAARMTSPSYGGCSSLSLPLLRHCLRRLRELDGLHLISFFQDRPLADYSMPEVSHVSLRGGDPGQISAYGAYHRKPVLLDDCGSEGNAPSLWDSLPGSELVHRLWIAFCRKGYAAHSEALRGEEERCWRSGAGRLEGEAPARLALLRRILEEAPAGLAYMPEYYDAPTIGLDGFYYLQYHGFHRFPVKTLTVPQGTYLVEIIDTWNMTVEALPEITGTRLDIPLPVREGLALRLRRKDADERMKRTVYRLSEAGIPVPFSACANRLEEGRLAEDQDNFVDAPPTEGA